MIWSIIRWFVGGCVLWWFGFTTKVALEVRDSYALLFVLADSVCLVFIHIRLWNIVSCLVVSWCSHLLLLVRKDEIS